MSRREYNQQVDKIISLSLVALGLLACLLIPGCPKQTTREQPAILHYATIYDYANKIEAQYELSTTEKCNMPGWLHDNILHLFLSDGTQVLIPIENARHVVLSERPPHEDGNF